MCHFSFVTLVTLVTQGLCQLSIINYQMAAAPSRRASRQGARGAAGSPWASGRTWCRWRPPHRRARTCKRFSWSILFYCKGTKNPGICKFIFAYLFKSFQKFSTPRPTVVPLHRDSQHGTPHEASRHAANGNWQLIIDNSQRENNQPWKPLTLNHELH